MANIALRAARFAGQHIVRGFDRPDLIDVSEKSYNNFVTNIDRETEQIIIGTLKEKYPDHKITAEESGTSGNLDSPYEWIIDPLDGTANFARQIPHFCVSIACVHEGKLAHGVVLDPIRQEEFVASRGKGATLNNRRIRVSQRDSLEGAIVATGTRDLWDGSDNEAATDRQLLDLRCVTRQSGSAALELAYIAAGRMDALWMRRLSPWDMAAGALLVIESGGIVGDFEGGANYMKSGNIVTGSPRCFKQLTSLIRKQFS